MKKPKPIPPARTLVAATPEHSTAATDIVDEMQEPTHPYKVMYAPKWDGWRFTAGTVGCQHGRHRTKEGAADCAAAHVRALRGKVKYFTVRIENAPCVLWAESERRPKGGMSRPTGD